MTEQQTSKLEQMRSNDVDIVLKLQKILLADHTSSLGLSYTQLIELAEIYGRLYHDHARFPPEPVISNNMYG